MRSSATRSIPDEVIDGLKELGALGMKVPEQYGGLGLSQVYYNRALALAGSWHASLSTLLSAHQSIGVAEPLLLFGTEEQKQRGCRWSRARTSRRSCSPSPTSARTRRASARPPTPDGRRLPAQRHEAVGDQRRDRRHRRGDGARCRTAASPRSCCPYDSDGVTVDAPQRVHGPARDRELGHARSRTSSSRART